MEIKERIEKVLEKKNIIQELRSSLNKKIQNHESTYSCELDAARNEYDREMAEIWKKYEAKVAEIKRRKDADYAALINEEYKTQQAIDTLENELRTSYNENTVYIRFGDLVDEIFDIAGDQYGTLMVTASVADTFGEYWDEESIRNYYLKHRILYFQLSILDTKEGIHGIIIDNLRQDAFEKMPNGNSLFDCISIEKEDFTGTVRLEFEDILSLFDVIVPINFESLTNGIGSNIDGVRVYHNPESLYYEAVMNCINKNKAHQRKLKKDN